MESENYTKQERDKILNYIKIAGDKLHSMMSTISSSLEKEFIHNSVSVELPVVLNYIALGTKAVGFESPSKMALDMIPTYWKEVLEFPSQRHSL
jgi:hypothetical protein